MFLLTKNPHKNFHPHSFHINVFMYGEKRYHCIKLSSLSSFMISAHTVSAFIICTENKVPIKHIANVIIQCNKSAIAYHYASYKTIMIMIIIIIFTDFMLHLFIFNDHPHADEKWNVWMSFGSFLLLGRGFFFSTFIHPRYKNINPSHSLLHYF